MARCHKTWKCITFWLWHCTVLGFKAVGVLKLFYYKMIHVSCLANGLYRVAEGVKRLFLIVNNLISSILKKYFWNDQVVSKYLENNCLIYLYHRNQLSPVDERGLWCNTEITVKTYKTYFAILLNSLMQNVDDAVSVYFR